jgi:hypothetical protein
MPSAPGARLGWNLHESAVVAIAACSVNLIRFILFIGKYSFSTLVNTVLYESVVTIQLRLCFGNN